MISIKKFIDKISLLESRPGAKDVVLPIAEARQLRDELAKLLADLHTMQEQVPQKSAALADLRVEIVGGKW